MDEGGYVIFFSLYPVLLTYFSVLETTSLSPIVLSRSAVREKTAEPNRPTLHATTPPTMSTSPTCTYPGGEGPGSLEEGMGLMA